MAVLDALTDEEKYLLALLQDESGIDIAELTWEDSTREDRCWRAYPFQVAWWRDGHDHQIDQCVGEGQLVLTVRGLIPIEEVVVGDRVLTHKNRWRPVTHVWDKGTQEVVRLVGHGHEGLVVTPDHPVYARRMRRASQPKDGHKGKKPLEPEWLAPENWEWNDGSGKMVANWASGPTLVPDIGERPDRMQPAYRSGRQNLVEDVLSPEWLWLYGLFLAEGSTYIPKRVGDLTYRSSWCLHEDELLTVLPYFDKLKINYSLEFDGEFSVKVNVTSRPITQWLRREAGHLSYYKHVAPWVFGLPEALRREVLDGALFGDGHRRSLSRTSASRTEYVTTSRQLAYGLKILAQGLGFSASTKVSREPGFSEIQGSRHPTRRAWVVSLETLDGQRKARTQDLGDGWMWGPITSVLPAIPRRVFDLEVEEDHSFVVEGIPVHNCSRAVGKTMSIIARAYIFPILHPGGEMLVCAPQLVHLEPLTSAILRQFASNRLGMYLLPPAKTSVKQRPFQVNFANGARLMGRIAGLTGKQLKGQHPIWLEQDEAQDFPKEGWMELIETLRDLPGARWRVHGVSKGMQDEFYQFTLPKEINPENPFKVHRIVAMHRPGWTDKERQDKIQEYGGSRESPDYRRNVLGLHGDPAAPVFVTPRLFACVDDNLESAYNTDEYKVIQIKHEWLTERGQSLDIEQFLLLPDEHLRRYRTFWIGMDVGLASDPSEILVFAEYLPKGRDQETKLKLITRIKLERISNPMQVNAIGYIYHFYASEGANVTFSMDRTGIGFPLWQDLQERYPDVSGKINGYNFSENIIVDFDEAILAELTDYDDPVEKAGIKRKVIEASTDVLRDLVDTKRVELPWDQELLAEFQGQTYSLAKGGPGGGMDMYGRPRRQFNKTAGHAFDASRMAVLGWKQMSIEQLLKLRQKTDEAPVYDYFISV